MQTRFQHFTVDVATRQLLSDGKEIHLSPKAFDLLRVLLARRPNVVSKEELFQQVWPDSYVVEANLNVVVGEVRRALGDNAQTPRFIRTVHGVGFAFFGNANEIENNSAPPIAETRCWLIGKDRNFPLADGDNVVGRDPSCSIWLDDPDVSRRHACIHIDSIHGSALLEDLDSTNGTSIGRAQVNGQKSLVNGDVIRIGRFEFKFRSEAPQETRRIRRKPRA
jgi:DNA-binding winged helix-turn-helix (wHTH) protein